MGINEFEPRVVNQLLEFSYRYISTMLQEAKVYAAHARRNAVELDDVRIAVQMHVDNNLTSPPPRDLLVEVAAKRNAIPLPIPRQCGGLSLPPERFCLTATNYRLKSNKNINALPIVRANPGKARVDIPGKPRVDIPENARADIPEKYNADIQGKSNADIPRKATGISTNNKPKRFPAIVPKYELNSAGKVVLSRPTVRSAATTNTSNNSTNNVPTAAVIRINNQNTSSTKHQITPTPLQTVHTPIQTAATIQIQSTSSSNGGPPMFSMTIDPEVLNSALNNQGGTRGRKRTLQEEIMEETSKDGDGT